MMFRALLCWARRSRCRKLRRVLLAYLDGQVDERTARRLARHLEGCRDCGLEADTYRQIKRALARRRPDVAEDSLRRLRSFADDLTR